MKKITTPTVILRRGGRPHSLLVQKSRIIIVDGPQQGQDMIVEEDAFTIGSSSQNDVVIDDRSVSKKHCRIELGTEGYLIRDLNSTNGTVVQGMKVTEGFISEGAEIQIGRTRLLFCPLQDAAEYTLSRNDRFGGMLGSSINMKRAFHIAEVYSPTDSTILIEGATGTGKEVMAEEIHRHSKRSDGPFVVIDCGSLAPGIIESELFGHTKGAFTGAASDRMGAFEHANGGTVFLDEIGELALDLQPRLLRVLEKREVRRVGSNKRRSVDVRIVCACNVPLEHKINAGLFREDLYFRISTVRIALPALKSRRDDIPVLARHFLRSFTDGRGSEKLSLLEENMGTLTAYDWPGNVRELRNYIEMALHAPGVVARPGRPASHAGDASDREADGPVHIAQGSPFKDAKGKLINNFEARYLKELLDRNDWNVSQAAREAEIERAYLIRLMKKHGMK